MLDVEKALQRIRSLSPEEWNRIMRESLDAAQIEYSKTPGKVIFNGFPPEIMGYTQQEITYDINNETKSVAEYRRPSNGSDNMSVRKISETKEFFALQGIMNAA